MNSKYNVLVNYLGDNEFKFIVKKIGEVSISKSKPVYIYNADVETINNLRTLRRMLVEIKIGAKPTGAYKVYNMDDFDKQHDRLLDSRIVQDRRGYIETVSNNEISSILSSGTNGPIIEEPETPVVDEPKTEDKPKSQTTKKTTKKNTGKKKTSKK